MKKGSIAIQFVYYYRACSEELPKYCLNSLDENIYFEWLMVVTCYFYSCCIDKIKVNFIHTTVGLKILMLFQLKEKQPTVIFLKSNTQKLPKKRWKELKKIRNSVLFSFSSSSIYFSLYYQSFWILAKNISYLFFFSCYWF